MLSSSGSFKVKPLTNNPKFIMTLRNIVWKREKCYLPAFSPLPTIFPTLIRTNFYFWDTFTMLSADSLNLGLGQFFFLNKPWLLRVCSTSNFKTLWEKEKLLITSSFSFSQCLLPFVIFAKFEIVVCKLFQFGRLKNLSFGKVST